jgi:flagellar protein FliL
MADHPATPAAAPAAAPKRKSKRLLFAVLGLVVLGGAGGGGFWYWKQSAAAAAAAPEPAKEATGLIPLDPFVVNLADREASRFLRVTIKLVVDDEEIAKEVEHHEISKSRVRSAILEVLSGQESAKLTTPEGKAELKRVIAEHAGKALHTEVRDVLFTDFVVQF